MKTRLMTLLLALAMTVSLTACGGNGASSAQGGAASSQPTADASADASGETGEALPEEAEEPEETQPAEEEQPAEEKPEEPAAPAEKPEEKPVQKPVQKPAEKPVQKPAEKPAEKPVSGGSSDSSSAGSQTPETQSVDLSTFYESQTTAYGEGNFPAMMALDGDALDVMYPGLSDLKPKQCLVYMPMISAVAAEYALVEVSSADQVETVKSIFQSRIDYQVEQGAFYPATVEKWQNSTRIVSNGNYVMLVCFDRCDDAVSSFNALF